VIHLIGIISEYTRRSWPVITFKLVTMDDLSNLKKLQDH